jgi:hypothetical protein
VWCILREFGSWGEAIRIANNELKGVVFDESYLVKAVCEFGLWTKERFVAAHKNNPKIIPSKIVVLKVFGAFSKLFREAKKSNIKRTLWDYFRLSKRLKRVPLMGDLRKCGLDIKAAVEFYGSKREMDEFLFGKEEVENARKH